MRHSNILLLTWEAFIGDELSDQLNRIFNHKLALFNWYPGSTEESFENIALIICTIQSLRDAALEAGVIKEETPYIVAHRSITSAGLAQLEKVMRLPPGTKVTVCSNNLDGSKCIVDYLISLNISHLDFIPYTRNIPDINIGDSDTALVFGFPNTHPPGAKHIIDLGKRVLNNQTIISMIQIGGFNEDFSQFECSPLSANPLADVSVASQLAQALDHQEAINEQFEAILKYTPSGIMITDRDYRVIQYNKTILEALNKSSLEIPHQTELMNVSEELWNIVKSVNITEKPSQIWTLNNVDYIVSVYKVGTKQLKEYKIIVLQKAPVYQIKSKSLPSPARKTFLAKYKFEDIRTQDPNMERLKQFAMKIAQSDGNVAIYGESGTGKELFAQAIHNHSHRCKGPFVPVNVSALQDSLIESELFGYADGAFTGAMRGGKPGLFELADTGTIFLDEIGDLSFSLQAKLLRAIQEREIVRVGGSQIIPINVRIIAATNKNLLELVHEGKFRQDLFYRLNVLPLNLLPLRNRKADISLLLQEKLADLGFPFSILSEKNKKRLLSYGWPGNVREVENVCAYISCLSNLSTEEFDEHLYTYIKNSLTSEELENPAEYLAAAGEVQQGCDDLCVEILTDMAIAAKENIPINTKAIYDRINLTNKISMGRIREALKTLKSGGLILIGRTRQGMRITEKGLAFIHNRELS